MIHCDYVIVGCGPCGMLLSLMLAHKKKRVCIIESNSYIGGCWNMDKVDNMYIENSPKIIGNYNYFEQLLNILHLKPEQQYNPYSEAKVDTKFYSIFIKSLTYHERFVFIQDFVIYNLGYGNNNLTIEEWMKMHKFSKLGYRTIRKLAILLANVPERFSVLSFFKFFSNDQVKTLRGNILKHDCLWINNFLEYIANSNKIQLYLNHDLVRIQSNDHKVFKVVVCDKILNTNKIFKASEHYVLCVPPLNLYNIVKNSNQYIQNNWMDFATFKTWSFKSSYTGFGFQLHFNSKQRDISDFFWACKGEWNIVLLDKSLPDENIYSWSCVIIDLDKQSTNINKSANQCTYNEVIAEALFQLESPQPYAITSYNGLYYDNGSWKSKDSAFCHNCEYFNNNGKIRNLTSLGSHTLNSISTMETSLESVVKFSNKHNINSIIQTKISYNLVVFMFVIFIIIINKLKV